MKILFMGTPEFAVPILKVLEESHEVLAVVTQPDRPKGRGQGVVLSAVKEYALERGLTILQPDKVRKNDEFAETLTALGADIFVVVAYGQILPERILKIPPLGCVNIHASLLPKYRGAAPMQRAILAGETVTGVTIMYMDKGMDTGDMILKRDMPIGEADRFADVHDKMAELSCACILEAIKMIGAGTAPREPQDHDNATYAPMLKKEEGLIDWNGPAERIVNQVRALDPWPGTYTYIDGQMLKIWECSAWDGEVSDGAAPGEVLEAKGSLLVMAGDKAVSLSVVQGQGGKRMNAGDYLRGRSVVVGDILGGAQQ